MYNFASLIIDRMEERKLSRTAQVVSKTMYEAMRLLAASGGPMTVTQLREQIAQKLEFTEWEQQSPSTKTQQSRWAINMTYYVFDYIKAGFLAKDHGLWYLTEEGQKMLDRTSEEVFAAAHTASRIKRRDAAQYESIDEDMKEIIEETPQMILEDARSQAMDGLRQRITTMDWQDFQKLIAALLRAMGYYVPFVAPQGPDGGIDVLAYENASGAGQRFIVQAKRYKDASVGVDTVRGLAALLHKQSDIGMVVTSGRFTQEAIRFAQSCKFNLRLIELNELTSLWISYFDRLTLAERALLPIQAVYFLEE